MTLHWHSRSRFSAAAAETHMSWSFLIRLFRMEMSVSVLEIPWFVQPRCSGVWSGGSLTPALPGSV